MDDLLSHISWMAWTWQTELFFLALALCLVTLTVLAVLRPETPHAGILRFATTRGDRFFVSLIVAAFVFVIFIRLGGQDFAIPAVTALVIAAFLFRFA